MLKKKTKQNWGMEENQTYRLLEDLWCTPKSLSSSSLLPPDALNEGWALLPTLVWLLALFTNEILLPEFYLLEHYRFLKNF